jgi:hypothetical protein
MAPAASALTLSLSRLVVAVSLAVLKFNATRQIVKSL